MELIRVWGRKSPKLDIYIMKMLIPLCASPDEDTQLESIRVVEALLPGFATSTPQEIAFIWSYVSKLLSAKLESSVCLAAVHLMSSFPTLQLSGPARDELFALLFSLCFHKSIEIRAAVYRFIGQSGDIWRSTSQTNAAMAMLLLSLGDGHAPNVVLLIEQITFLGQNSIAALLPTLNKLKSVRKLNELELVRAYDAFATALAANKQDFRGIIEAMAVPIRVDECWAFFLNGVPENQLVRPEEYDYLRNFIHSPIWISLVYTKFTVPPPPMGEGIRREVSPTNPIGKRRFACGFMQCLLPTLGNLNPVIRAPAATAAFLCCFKGNNGQGDMIRGLLEYVTQQLLASKYVSYQLSALDVFKCILRCKVPGISESIYQQFMDLYIDLLTNSNSTLVQASILGIFELFCLVFPKAIGPRLAAMLDITRPLLADIDVAVRDAAFRLYPLIFKCATDSFAVHCNEVLRDEIEMLTNMTSPAALGDPLVSALTPDQALKILECDIISLGLLSISPEKAYEAAQYLIPFLADLSPIYRLAAFYAITSLDAVISVVDSPAITWILLPLFGDPSYDIRLAWSKYRRSMPSPIQMRVNAVGAHPEDNKTIALSTWEDVLADHPTLAVLPKNLADITYELDELIPTQLSDLPIEDDGFHLPIISERLMSRFKEIVAGMTQPLSEANQNMVLYQLECFRDNMDIVPYMNLVLSEFACYHENSYEATAGVLLGQLSVDLDSSQVPSIESAIIGLRNIMTHSRSMMKTIEENVFDSQYVTHGELTVMIYYNFDLFTNLSPNVSFEMITKLCQVVGSPRYSEEKRIL
ncbi:hypothetical protein HDU91_000920, partial [Kappamyces sp. JEL0680]